MPQTPLPFPRRALRFSAHPTARFPDPLSLRERFKARTPCNLCSDICDIQHERGCRFTVDVPGDVRRTREKMDLSQSAFAALLGVSVCTLQDREQGRRQPTGPALSLLRVADKHPRALLD